MYRVNKRPFKPKMSSLKNFQERLGTVAEAVERHFFMLDAQKLDLFYQNYGSKYGQIAEDYAKITYYKWKNGNVNLSEQTKERLLRLVPKYLSVHERKELVKKLYKNNRQSIVRHLDIDMRNPFEGFYNFQQLVNDFKNSTTQNTIPEDVADLFEWINDSDMTAVLVILKEYDRELCEKIEKISEVELERLRQIMTDTSTKHVELVVNFPNGQLMVTIHKVGLIQRIGEMLRR